VTSGDVVLIGLGNCYRRDDGVGIVAADALDDLTLPGVRVVTGIAEPLGLLEAWTGAALAVVIDAALITPSTAGRVHRCTLDDVAGGPDGLSSHTIDIGRAHAFAQALGRAPDAVVVFTIEPADTGHGIGLTPDVAAAVPEVVDMVLAEINRPLSNQGLPPLPASLR